VKSKAVRRSRHHHSDQTKPAIISHNTTLIAKATSKPLKTLETCGYGLGMPLSPLLG
jgi:hypothetical protein